VIATFILVAGVYVGFAGTPIYEEWADRDGNGVIEPQDEAAVMAYYDANMGSTAPAYTVSVPLVIR
jgi:hypothetical protein